MASCGQQLGVEVVQSSEPLGTGKAGGPGRLCWEGQALTPESLWQLDTNTVWWVIKRGFGTLPLPFSWSGLEISCHTTLYLAWC
jgi:hypothetical protein